MSNTVEDDNTAFVVYVPPNGSDKTVESCLRLGGGPAESQQATTDENKAYQDAVAGSQTLSDLSSSTYHPTSGIALITPGTINLVAAGGVNVTSGTSYTNSTTGSSYNITQAKSGTIVSASYSSTDLGWWSTSSFNQAVTVAVNTVPLQATIGLGATYAVSGPLTCSNNWGFVWSSTIGFSVTATLARITNFGWHTIVTTDLDGSNQAYYTKNQASTAGEEFTWTVPLKDKFAAYDAKQNLACKLVDAAAFAADAVATAYALFGALDADTRKPADVQSWLKAAEPIAIACTALNGICAAVGIALGKWVDDQTADDSENNIGATKFVIGDGSFELTTATPGPSELLGPKSPYLKLDREKGTITLTTGQGAGIILDRDSITISGATVTISGPNVKITQVPPAAPPPAAGAGDLAPGAIPGPSGNSPVA